jgi:3-carboxy-cis,cis-muconate cycloisomerase
MHAAMAGEHERAAGAWHAEWETVSDLLRLTGSAAAWAREMLEGLEVDAGRMRANLAAAGDAIPAARAPEEHLGAAGALIDRALAAHRERGG